MINGLHIDVSSKELKDRLASKRDYHQEKADYYSSQIKSLRENTDEEISIQATNNPLSGLGQSLKTHVLKRDFFAFMYDHIVENEVYRLSQGDLVVLEIIDRGY